LESAQVISESPKESNNKNSALVGRQTIYNSELEVFAYELLYRPSHQKNFAPDKFDGNKATSEVMLNAFLEIGLDHIVGEKRAFINMTEQFVDGSIAIPFPTETIVVEILEDIKPTPAVKKGIQDLKDKGYMIALDDFVFEEEFMSLIPYADIIKIDLMQISREELTKHVKDLKLRTMVKLLAEKVETLEEFEFCKVLGFDYYQGYFLEKPVIIKGQKMPANKVAILQLINRLQDTSVEVDELQELIKTDASLSYKILRYINSPGFNLGTEVTSIKQAVMLLGLDTLKHWMTLVVLSGLSSKSTDIIQKVLTRAKMCELLAKIIKQENSDDYFLVGMFSMLDVMLDQEMDEILKSIPIRKELKDALLKYKGKEGKVLKVSIAYEHGDWEAMKAGTITPKSLKNSYIEAIGWADETISGLSN